MQSLTSFGGGSSTEGESNEQLMGGTSTTTPSAEEWRSLAEGLLSILDHRLPSSRPSTASGLRPNNEGAERVEGQRGSIDHDINDNNRFQKRGYDTDNSAASAAEFINKHWQFYMVDEKTLVFERQDDPSSSLSNTAATDGKSTEESMAVTDQHLTVERGPSIERLPSVAEEADVPETASQVPLTLIVANGHSHRPMFVSKSDDREGLAAFLRRQQLGRMGRSKSTPAGHSSPVPTTTSSSGVTSRESSTTSSSSSSASQSSTVYSQELHHQDPHERFTSTTSAPSDDDVEQRNQEKQLESEGPIWELQDSGGGGYETQDQELCRLTETEIAANGEQCESQPSTAQRRRKSSLDELMEESLRWADFFASAIRHSSVTVQQSSSLRTPPAFQSGGGRPKAWSEGPPQKAPSPQQPLQKKHSVRFVEDVPQPSEPSFVSEEGAFSYDQQEYGYEGKRNSANPQTISPPNSGTCTCSLKGPSFHPYYDDDDGYNNSAREFIRDNNKNWNNTFEGGIPESYGYYDPTPPKILSDVNNNNNHHFGNGIKEQLPLQTSVITPPNFSSHIAPVTTTNLRVKRSITEVLGGCGDGNYLCGQLSPEVIMIDQGGKITPPMFAEEPAKAPLKPIMERISIDVGQQTDHQRCTGKCHRWVSEVKEDASGETGGKSTTLSGSKSWRETNGCQNKNFINNENQNFGEHHQRPQQAILQKRCSCRCHHNHQPHQKLPQNGDLSSRRGQTPSETAWDVPRKCVAVVDKGPGGIVRGPAPFLKLTFRRYRMPAETPETTV